MNRSVKVNATSGGVYIDANAFYNAEALHASAITLNAVDNALLRYRTGRTDVSITAVNHPLPYTEQARLVYT